MDQLPGEDYKNFYYLPSFHRSAIDPPHPPFPPSPQAYNSDGSDFYVLAAEFSKRFEEKVAKLLADSGLKPAATQVLPPSTVGLNDTEPTPTERQDFARFLFRIGKEELGKVVTGEGG